MSSKSSIPYIIVAALIGLIVVLILGYVFLFVTTSFKREATIDVDLPEIPTSSAKKTIPAKFRLRLFISAQGDYLFEKQVQGKSPQKYPVADKKLETLKNAIKILSKNDSSIPVTIAADAKSPHKSFIVAMDALAQLGFKRISVQTAKPK